MFHFSLSGFSKMTDANHSPYFSYADGAGKALLALPSPFNANSVHALSDGKLLVAGRGEAGLTLLRLDADGGLDTSFGNQGTLSIDPGFLTTVTGSNTVLVQPDGKIVVVGGAGFLSSENQAAGFSIARFNSDGSVDSGFASGGQAFLPIGERISEPKSCILQSDGKIVLAGRVYGEDGDEIGLIRVNSDGTLDQSFGIGGQFIHKEPTGSMGMSLALQNDGAIVVGLQNGGGVCAIRLTTDGVLDSSFSGDGKADIDLGSNLNSFMFDHVFPLGDGGVILVGKAGEYAYQNNLAIRLLPDGSIDKNFGVDGLALYNLGQFSTVAMRPDGGLILGGERNGDYTIIALDRNGILDSGFSSDGVMQFDGSGCDDFMRDVVVLSDGRLAVLGNSVGSSAKSLLNIVILGADGSIDQGFSTGASVNDLKSPVYYTEGLNGTVMNENAAVFDADLAILNGGLGNYSGSSITLMRQGGGSPDDVFGCSGRLHFEDGRAFIDGIDVGSVSSRLGVFSVVFNGSANQERVNALLSALTYSNTSNRPGELAVIDWIFDDGSGLENSKVVASFDVNIRESVDSISSSVSTVLPDDFDDLQLTGTLSINGFGNIYHNVIRGNSGNNHLYGLEGDDTLYGDGGSDTLDGGLGADILNGGSGDDFYRVDDRGDKVFESGGSSGGVDSVFSSVDFSAGVGVENVSLSGGAVWLAGNDLNNALNGNSVANEIRGWAGDDVLNGGAGADSMYGGAGNDIYYVDNSGDKVLEGSSLSDGVDTVYSGVSFSLSSNVERIYLTGSAAISAFGNDLANTVFGNSAANIISGGLGNDTLSGAAGNDVLIGGVGSDSLYGGVGADRFIFDSRTGTDRCLDFVSRADKFVFDSSSLGGLGDRDGVIEGALLRSAAGGFGRGNELVVFSSNISGSISVASAIAKIGKATSAYAIGDERVFVVDNGLQTGIFLFKSADADAQVETNELSLLGIASVAQTNIVDYLFQA